MKPCHRIGLSDFEVEGAKVATAAAKWDMNKQTEVIVRRAHRFSKTGRGCEKSLANTISISSAGDTPR
ncbi:MAG: hypothetical protein ACXW37_12290, partial [Nitrospira sp.]